MQNVYHVNQTHLGACDKLGNKTSQQTTDRIVLCRNKTSECVVYYQAKSLTLYQSTFILPKYMKYNQAQ